MKKQYIFCDICGCSFNSQDRKCKECQFYEEGLKKFGRTKTKLDYQIEAGLSSIKFMLDNM